MTPSTSIDPATGQPWNPKTNFCWGEPRSGPEAAAWKPPAEKLDEDEKRNRKIGLEGPIVCLGIQVLVKLAEYEAAGRHVFAMDCRRGTTKLWLIPLPKQPDLLACNPP